ncbi:hypothetical protein [Nocardioides daejeonensis]|uniref:hypothetical protein n=1 Tax=Nocardioides daejeonensis TaxID=1046556 RepID=UPI000D74E734|nr:hypothetical protein [Nocardioides daejeonensis]
MPEIDDPAFAGDVANGVHPPAFAAIRTGAVRRTRRHRAAAAGISALAVLAVIGGVWLGNGAEPDAGAPAGTPSPTPSRLPTTPSDPELPRREPMRQEPPWLASDRAFVDGFAMVPGEETVASTWFCDRRCEGAAKRVLVVSASGRRSVIAIPRGTLTAAGGGRFIVEPYRPGAPPRVFDIDGEVAMTMESGSSPLAAGEVVAAISGSGLRYIGLFGINGKTATMHELVVPPEILLQAVHADGRHLTFEGSQTFWLSDDGGASGTRNDLDTDGYLTSLVPSARPGTRVVLLGGDGATLFPLQRVARLHADGTNTVEDVHLESPFVLASLVRRDGSLVLATVGGEFGDPLRIWRQRPEGGAFEELIPTGFEAATDLFGTISTSRGPIMVATTVDRGQALISTDGEVWKSVRMR